MPRLPHLLACLLALPSSLLLAADCSALKDLKLADTTITLAQSVPSGDLTMERVPAPLRDLPEFCRVAGILRPTSDSKIRFEVWLPQQDWNGRYLGVGNGGFAGSIGYQQFAAYLKRGFAVAGSDAGHQAEVTDATWAFGHPEKIKDFGWRAVHLTAVLAPQIISAYYGKPQQKAYFDSCSDGGREALMEAQRFPNDYDGILAGAPANAWSSLLSAGVATLQNLTADPSSYISGLKLPAIQKAALDACDTPDGVKVGFINNPAQCHFDPTVLLCKADDELDCLTQPQIDALKKLYQGATDSKGTLLFPGFSMGDETSWGPWIVGQDPGGALGSHFVLNYFRYMVTGDPRWNVLTADMGATLRQAKEKSADLDATNPDLTPFATRGGKLILYHGWNDPAISPWNTIAYYTEVQKTMGTEKAASFTRLYMFPGMEHCAGGPGPNAFGQLGLSTAKGPTNGIFDSLQSWVEKGSPIDDVYATKSAVGPDGAMKPVMTRPLCAYPATAKYKGSGDTTDAENFTCEKP